MTYVLVVRGPTATPEPSDGCGLLWTTLDIGSVPASAHWAAT